MDAVNWAAAEVGMVIVASVFVLLIAVEVIERLKNRKVKQPARADNRIPDYEMRLVGDDYRECVSGYFGKLERRRQIVEGVLRERH